jgi:hypothetical protein
MHIESCSIELKTSMFKFIDYMLIHLLTLVYQVLNIHLLSSGTIKVTNTSPGGTQGLNLAKVSPEAKFHESKVPDKIASINVINTSPSALSLPVKDRSQTWTSTEGRSPSHQVARVQDQKLNLPTSLPK